jgi:hypothetical protein
MVRKVAGRSLPSIVEEPPRAHDAGLVTAGGPDGGFCVNRPRTNPIASRCPFPSPVFAKARSGRRRIQIRAAKGGPATCRSIEFFNKAYTFSLIDRAPWWASRDAVRAGFRARIFLRLLSPPAAGATSMSAVRSPAKSRTCQETAPRQRKRAKQPRYSCVWTSYEASRLPRRGNDTRWPRAPNCAFRTPVTANARSAACNRARFSLLPEKVQLAGQAGAM